MNSDYLKAYHFCKNALDDINETEKELANPTDEWKKLYSNYECTVRSFQSYEEYKAYLEQSLQSFKEDYNEWFNELQELKKDLTENDIFNLHLVGMYDM